MSFRNRRSQIGSTNNLQTVDYRKSKEIFTKNAKKPPKLEGRVLKNKSEAN